MLCRVSSLNDYSKLAYLLPALDDVTMIDSSSWLVFVTMFSTPAGMLGNWYIYYTVIVILILSPPVRGGLDGTLMIVGTAWMEKIWETLIMHWRRVMSYSNDHYLHLVSALKKTKAQTV